MAGEPLDGTIIGAGFFAAFQRRCGSHPRGACRSARTGLRSAPSTCHARTHIVDCLRSGQPAECEGEDYLHTTAAMFACYRSAETGTAVAPADLLAEVR